MAAITCLEVAEPAPQRAWELVGIFYRNAGRLHEALAISWALYQQLLAAQDGGVRVHKGMPLVWMSDCYARLGFRVHAKRFLMLTLCEDALLERGSVSPDTSGVNFRLVWQHGLRDAELRRYMSEVWQISQESPAISRFPEALLQRIDNAWLTELPSPDEALVYLVNQQYVRSLLDAECRAERVGEDHDDGCAKLGCSGQAASPVDDVADEVPFSDTSGRLP